MNFSIVENDDSYRQKRQDIMRIYGRYVRVLQPLLFSMLYLLPDSRDTPCGRKLREVEYTSERFARMLLIWKGLASLRHRGSKCSIQ